MIGKTWRMALCCGLLAAAVPALAQTDEEKVGKAGAALMLGVTRNTLRKKLLAHKLI